MAGYFTSRAWRRFLAPLCSVAMLASAQAHLMVAQKGTLNLVGDGAFMVLSLPVSSFRGVDDDGDGLLSMAELRAHAAAIEAQVLQNVQLSDAKGARPLQGLMLTLSPPDEAPSAPAPQLVVMGRFALASPDTAGLVMSISGFGKAADEQSFSFAISQGDATQTFEFSDKARKHALTLGGASKQVPSSLPK